MTYLRKYLSNTAKSENEDKDAEHQSPGSVLNKGRLSYDFPSVVSHFAYDLFSLIQGK